MRSQSIGVLLLLFSAAFHPSAVEAARPTEFSVFSEDLLPGRLFIPPEAADLATPRPLILFLHGAGETGTNNRSQVNGNINNLLLAARREGPFLYAPPSDDLQLGRYDAYFEPAAFVWSLGDHISCWHVGCCC